MSSDPFFTGLCNHDRVKRIDENFVKCVACGHSVVSQSKQPRNKTRHEFTSENKSFQKNFDRNFSNLIPQVENYGPAPLEYYTDVNQLNFLIVDRTVLFNSDPPKYKISLNDKSATVTDNRIKEIMSDIKAIRVDAQQFKYMQRS